MPQSSKITVSKEYLNKELVKLQSLVDRNIKLEPNMPKPRIHLVRDHKFQGKNKDIAAHVHSNWNDKMRGWICFTPKGLLRSLDEVLGTLAHELAHLQHPRSAHDSQKFREAMSHYYLKLIDSFPKKERELLKAYLELNPP